MIHSLAAAALLTGVVGGGGLEAQGGPLAMHASAPGGRSAEEAIASSALARGGYAVVIDLDVNRLYFKQGEVTLWSAPVGTGTGLRLETEEHEWDFSTPNGVFHVQYKEEDPVWIAPDWYFVENDLPVPPANDRRRRFPGGLGAAAVYIGHDLAIHGTDKPELLGQRVSHGCIRLSNKDALRLFHNVQVGTEVVIVGGKPHPEPERISDAGEDARATFDPAAPRPQPKDALLEDWKKMPTERLLQVLEDELWMDAEESRWPEVARLLLNRGLGRDDLALQGLLAGVADLPGAVEREYQTFLADAFSRGSRRTLEALSELQPRPRARAAEAIVAASIGLFPGEPDAHSVPWPTSRVPRAAVGSEGRRGWSALSRAEERLRSASRRAL